MAAPDTKLRRIDLKRDSEYDERWVQNIIAQDPSILGLGDLVLRDRERVQPRAGRLDLLLQERETNRRFEVEVQLGSTDESHIVRVIEYWDTERRRYPQYDHCAVLVAERVTSRFLNVISLFNGTIPLIAVQMQAFVVGDNATLIFATVLDELKRGPVDEDEDAEVAPTDRSYWEALSSKDVISLVDNVMAILRERDDSLELKYNKFYIGLVKNGKPFNFVTFEPRKQYMNLRVRLPKTESWDTAIAATDIDTLSYADGMYRLQITKDSLASHGPFIKDLISEAQGEPSYPTDL